MYVKCFVIFIFGFSLKAAYSIEEVLSFYVLNDLLVLRNVNPRGEKLITEPK